MTTLEFLEKIVRIDSYSFKKKENRQVLGLCLEYLGEEMVQEVFELRWLKNPDGKYADALYLKAKQTDADKPRVLLMGHSDIVFPNFADFDIRIKGDKFYGPGTIDMKSGIAVMLEAVKELYKQQGPLQNISIVIVAEEEQGTRIENYPELEAIAKDTDIALVYEASGDVSQEPIDFFKKPAVVSRKGIIIGRLRAKAQGGHSGVLKTRQQRHSAIDELIFQAGKIQAAADYEVGTTTNVGVFKGGQAFNAIAQEAMIEFDARVQDIAEFDRLLALYKALPESKADIEVELELEIIAAVKPLPYSEANKALFERAKKVAHEAGIDLYEEHRGGGSDANRIIGVNPELAILDSMGPVGAFEHTTGEFLYLSSLPIASMLSQKLLQNLIN